MTGEVTHTLDNARKPAVVFDGKLTCPYCQNTDLTKWFFMEWSPVRRSIDSFKLKKLRVSEDSEVIDEETKDAHLFCDGCCNEVEIPKDINYDVNDG